MNIIIIIVCTVLCALTGVYIWFTKDNDIPKKKVNKSPKAMIFQNQSRSINDLVNEHYTLTKMMEDKGYFIVTPPVDKSSQDYKEVLLKTLSQCDAVIFGKDYEQDNICQEFYKIATLNKRSIYKA